MRVSRARYRGRCCSRVRAAPSVLAAARRHRALLSLAHAQVDGINYVAIKKSSLYLMATTRFNVRAD